MKKPYDDLELEVIRFGAEDIITASQEETDDETTDEMNDDSTDDTTDDNTATAGKTPATAAAEPSN